MNRSERARPASTNNRRSTFSGRRIAACGATLALLLVTVGAGVAQASGGVAPPGQKPSSKFSFGSRNLSLGMTGDDVRTLNWILNGISTPARPASAVPFDDSFDRPTDDSVRAFQQTAGLGTDGIVEKTTRKALAKRMPAQLATWYGPGFWGNRTACGKTLRKKTIGVAHKKLPCGTKVTFAHKGHYVRAKVIDRGPYNGNYKWDLTEALASKLGFINTGAGPVRTAVVH